MNYNILNKSLNDVTTLTLADPATGELMYADENEKKPLTITLYGRSSKEYRKYMAAQVRKQQNESKNPKKKSLEEMTAENAEFLAAVSVSAANFDLAGEKIDNKEAFVKLYSNPQLVWIADQVTEHMSDLGNFVQK